MDENQTQINKKDNLKNLRTYQTDMADTVRTNEVSVIKVALAEQNKHEQEDLYRKVEGTPIKKIFWFIGGLIIIGIAVYGSYFLIKQKAKNNIPMQIAKEETIISYDEISPLSIGPTDNLINKIDTTKNLSSASNKNDSIKYIPIEENINETKTKLSVKEIFTRLEFRAPSSLVRSLSDSYMIGTYTKSANEEASSQPSLFFIFQSKDYEYTYAGMLEWEKTLASDALNLFKLNTTENKIQISARSWKDIIINNKDVRVFSNEDKKPILYYLFIDKENLVITDNSDTLKEITSRLSIKNIKPL